MKTLNIRKLCDDYGLAWQESSTGWIQMYCPFCYRGDGKYGLGYKDGSWTCFRCGKLREWETISKMLRVSEKEAATIADKYGNINHIVEQKEIKRASRIEFPYCTEKMKSPHRHYLEKRGFDPIKLEWDWNLLGTGALGAFKHRIIIPVNQNENLVCYQGRDITGLASERYKNCQNEKAVTQIKDCVYGMDEATGESIVITEGVTKVWRLGQGAVCTFGTVVTPAQIRILKRWKHRVVLFDGDEAGIDAAERLASELSIFPGETTIISSEVKDIAELDQAGADNLMRRLMK